ncbi:MAG: MarC family protein, partial [Candidatus Omnitrophota bacterium]
KRRKMFKTFLVAFIPVFVAVDAIGLLPIFISLTEGLNRKERTRIILQSVATAVCLAISFIFLGKAVFRFLNITVGDFMVAGGVLLFCIAIMDIINPAHQRRIPASEAGAVPLGTPLMVGPAVLTTALIMMEECGVFPTLAAVLANVALAGTIFMFSGTLINLMGEAGSRAISKVASLLLAAIAVMMVRKGIVFLVVLGG